LTDILYFERIGIFMFFFVSLTTIRTANPLFIQAMWPRSSF